MTLSPGGSTCGACFTGLASTTTNGCTATTSSSGSLTATVTSGPAPGCYSARPPHELPHARPDQADLCGGWQRPLRWDGPSGLTAVWQRVHQPHVPLPPQCAHRQCIRMARHGAPGGAVAGPPAVGPPAAVPPAAVPPAAVPPAAEDRSAGRCRPAGRTVS